MTLAEKIRASRRITIDVDGMRFIARRPTLEELYTIHNEDTPYPELARRFVESWENVRECDLLDGGADTPVGFDEALFSVALGDMPQVWQAIGKQLIKAGAEYYQRAEERRKNLPAG